MSAVRKSASLESILVTPMGQSMTPSEVIDAVINRGFRQVVQESGYEFSKEIVTAEHLKNCPGEFLHSPVEAILNSGNRRKLSFPKLEFSFSSSNHKRTLLDKLTNYLKLNKVSQTLVDDAILVSDELFTNAVYNAPHINPVTRKNEARNRLGEEVAYGLGQESQFFAARDESRLLLCCKDPFGTLDIHGFLNRIKLAYERGPAATMNFGAGGAGIGSYIIFNTGVSLYVGVWPLQATVFCCVLPLNMSVRKRSQFSKNLHLVEGF